jgi:hypothetical protein
LAAHKKMIMALEEFEEDRLTKREKSAQTVRSISNYIMGTLLIVAGCFFMFPINATRHFTDLYDPVMLKLFAGVCWIYGAFRIYRGYNKS